MKLTEKKKKKKEFQSEARHSRLRTRVVKSEKDYSRKAKHKNYDDTDD